MVMESNSASKKKQIRIGIALIIGIFGLVILGLYYSETQLKNEQGTVSEQIKLEREKTDLVLKKYKYNPSSEVSTEEEWMQSSSSEMTSLKKENETLKERMRNIEALMEAGNSLEKSTPVNLSEPESLYEDLPIQNPVQPMSVDSVRNGVVNNISAPSDTKKKDTVIGYVDLSPIAKDGGVSTGPKKNIETYIPAGSFAKILLLSGVDAPTGGQAESNPLPIIMKILDMAVLPNYFSSDIVDCHGVGAAKGDLSSERVMIRMESMTCILSDGDIIEIPIKGYVAGEDGKSGFRGKVVSKQGSLIAKSLFAGVASGMGSSITSQYQSVSTSALGNVTSVDPDKVVENGLATGATNTLEKIADYYFKRADELYPIIELAPNRIGELVITQGSFFDNAIVQGEDDE